MGGGGGRERGREEEKGREGEGGGGREGGREGEREEEREREGGRERKRGRMKAVPYSVLSVITHHLGKAIVTQCVDLRPVSILNVSLVVISQWNTRIGTTQL